AVTIRSRMQRDLGQLALDMEGVGDPDALDRTWAMETDRLDREAVTIRSRMQRDLGQLALDMEGVGDPDALDRTW
ncbi:hypothetical protein CNY89_29745, partial [Amaricoccus sp. HAR-UPW-R2A-40]